MLELTGKIPIRIYPFFWLLVIFIGYINTGTAVGTAIWAFVIFFSVLIHEMGHALTAMAFGQDVEVELVAFGGVTKRKGKHINLWQEFLIVLNGPLAGLTLAGLFYLLWEAKAEDKISIPMYAVWVTWVVNLFWTIVNLLPVQPLDGGQLLRIILEGIFGIRGVKIAFFISAFIAVSASIGFFVMGGFLIGALFMMFAFESFRAWKDTLPLTSADQDHLLQDLFKEAQKEFDSGDPEVAISKLDDVRNMSQEGVIHIASSEMLASIFVRRDRDNDAYRLLEPLKDQLSPQGMLILHRLIYKKKEWQKAIDLGNQLYRSYPSCEVALTNAMCHARLIEPGPAVGWLQTAFNEGLPNPEHVLSLSDFADIRNTEEFQHLREQYS